MPCIVNTVSVFPTGNSAVIRLLPLDGTRWIEVFKLCDVISASLMKFTRPELIVLLRMPMVGVRVLKSGKGRKMAWPVAGSVVVVWTTGEAIAGKV